MAVVDVAIIGGGIVGLSCAYEFARAGKIVVLLERNTRLGEETSTHNSGVIHAGIYYPPGSLKARMCVEGREILERRLPKWRVPHRFCGKLIVATDSDQIEKLEQLAKNGSGNGVSGLALIDKHAAEKIEPNIACTAALWSPGTGVLDQAEYLHAVEVRALELGAQIVTGAEVVAVERDGPTIRIRTNGRGELEAGMLINAAGLHADSVAQMCGDERFTIRPCRGEYASVIPRKANLINGLVYPVPEPAHLGVHLTKTIGGELWLGPNARFIESRSDYESDRLSPESFYEAAQRMCPSLERTDLRLGPSGIRPKLSGPGEPARDFVIEKQPDDQRIVHLVGIDSPGLTAAAAIGKHIVSEQYPVNSIQ
jgi:L-2-hydroxyglutarate oxidase LhgO